MRLGIWNGIVEWGPNQFGAIISETSIDSYRVYLADGQLRKIGPALAFVEAKQWANLFNPSLCNPDYYRARVNTTVPEGAAYFMVVPFTRGGVEMNVGPVKRMVDLGTPVAVTSLAKPLSAGQWCEAMLLVLALFAVA